MIEIKNLSRNWKEFSLNIDLHIEEGEYFVILGPTASGKTLLLELIAGFYHPDSGSIIKQTLPTSCQNSGRSVLFIRIIQFSHI